MTTDRVRTVASTVYSLALQDGLLRGFTATDVGYLAQMTPKAAYNVLISESFAAFLRAEYCMVVTPTKALGFDARLVSPEPVAVLTAVPTKSWP